MITCELTCGIVTCYEHIILLWFEQCFLQFWNWTLISWSAMPLWKLLGSLHLTEDLACLGDYLTFSFLFGVFIPTTQVLTSKMAAWWYHCKGFSRSYLQAIEREWNWCISQVATWDENSHGFHLGVQTCVMANKLFSETKHLLSDIWALGVWIFALIHLLKSLFAPALSVTQLCFSLNMCLKSPTKIFCCFVIIYIAYLYVIPLSSPFSEDSFQAV